MAKRLRKPNWQRGAALATMLLAGVSGAVIASCGGSGASSTTPSDSFIAFATNFQSFRTWASFHSDGPTDATLPADVLGPRTQYINRVPPKGSKSFPIGTMIVEARESGAMNIFAGVKRGGGFNATGAKDWEWFELKEGDGGVVTIVWRGAGPPTAGDIYGGDAKGGCNACHGTCASNDYVCSAKLQLTGF